MEIRFLKKTPQAIEDTISHFKNACAKNYTYLNLSNKIIYDEILYPSGYCDFSVWDSELVEILYMKGKILNQKLPAEILSNLNYSFNVMNAELNFFDFDSFEILKFNICIDFMELNQDVILEDLDKSLIFTFEEMKEIKSRSFYKNWELVKA